MYFHKIQLVFLYYYQLSHKQCSKIESSKTVANFGSNWITIFKYLYSFRVTKRNDCIPSHVRSSNNLSVHGVPSVNRILRHLNDLVLSFVSILS